MYKKVDSSVISDEFTKRWGTPVLVMEDQYGGQVVVIVDDHCYLAKLRRENGYKTTPYIFPELFDEMKKLPSLQRERKGTQMKNYWLKRKETKNLNLYEVDDGEQHCS